MFACYFFPGLFFILFSHCCSFMVVWGLGLWGWGLGLVFCGWVFQLMGFGACGLRPSWFFGFGALQYKHGRINLGNKIMLFEHPTCSLKIPCASSQRVADSGGMGVGRGGLSTMGASTSTLERITLSALKA